MTTATSNTKLLDTLNSWLQMPDKNIWNMMVSCSKWIWVSDAKVSRNTKDQGRENL